MQTNSVKTTIPDDIDLALLCGELNLHIKIIAKFFNVKITSRGHDFKIEGIESTAAENAINELSENIALGSPLSKSKVYDIIYTIARNSKESYVAKTTTANKAVAKYLAPKSKNQEIYLNNIYEHDINFVIGPSGTGKTYIAAAAAVHHLLANNVNKIILVRPAVEAGEKLGFLPGDMQEKVDPYLRPLLDAISSLLTIDKVNKLLEKNIIEIAPLAFMRGRTLNDAFIILDEAQNTSKEQMKMFLTRIGFGSRAIVTGDISQIDLPNHQVSGLNNAIRILSDIPAISFTYLNAIDVVRHPIITEIINAYDNHEN